MTLQCLQRGAVEPDLAVRQVLVVGEEEVGRALTGQLWDRRDVAFDVELDRAAPYQAPAVQVEQADAKAMRPQDRMLGRRRLFQHRRLDGAVLNVERHFHGVDAGGLEPCACPRMQVAAR